MAQGAAKYLIGSQDDPEFNHSVVYECERSLN